MPKQRSQRRGAWNEHRKVTAMTAEPSNDVEKVWKAAEIFSGISGESERDIGLDANVELEDGWASCRDLRRQH
jgi:hypothetical protein